MPDTTRPKVAVYAAGFDPPTAHHRRTAELVAGLFERVIVLPDGPRPERAERESLPIHRAVMADLNFAGLDRVRVELGDLERNRFTPNHELPALLGLSPHEVTHVVPAALVAGGAAGRSRVQGEWAVGAEFWRTAHFTVLHTPHDAPHPGDLPPRSQCLEVPAQTSTAEVRLRLLEGHAAPGLLMPRVADYVRRHGLFRATPPAKDGVYRPGVPRLRVVHDERNPVANALAAELKPHEHPDPDVIVVVGGDGTMLRAIRAHWRERLPFYGVNTGHLGFLLNDRAQVRFWERDLRLYQLPLLWVELVSETGEQLESLAFNDCWVERRTGQTAWIEVSVNGAVRMPRVVADGMLVATAAGSTSYARAMRATPLPFNTPLLTLAGSNVLKPEFWQPAVLTLDSEVTVRNLDVSKRPLQGFVDGVDYGRVREMRARVSKIAAVELLFAHEHDPVAKLAMLQFPQPPA